ncbi:hypothetical protein PG997_000918 [Apiospora hydei]|uniref:Uncharacterized protein n=1 Tax=Apiospora hydei TaxID=1337664 RepID=A0ABR1XCA7_9PEZI
MAFAIKLYNNRSIFLGCINASKVQPLDMIPLLRRLASSIRLAAAVLATHPTRWRGHAREKSLCLSTFCAGQGLPRVEPLDMAGSPVRAAGIAADVALHKCTCLGTQAGQGPALVRQSEGLVILGPDGKYSVARVHAHVKAFWSNINEAFDRLACSLRLAHFNRDIDGRRGIHDHTQNPMPSQ